MASAEALSFIGPLAGVVDRAGGQAAIILARTAAVHVLSLPAGSRLASGLEVLRSGFQQRGVVLGDDVLMGMLGAAMVFQKSFGG